MSACSRCGAPFTCAMADPEAGDAPCWCTQLPAVMPVLLQDAAPGCYCPACLKELVLQQEASAE